MPELPEVETIVRGLQGCIIGKRILSVRILHPKPLGSLTGTRFRKFLHNRIFLSVERIGKYLLFTFDNGGKMVVHLRMTGKFIFRADDGAQDTPPRHIRLIFLLDRGARLIFQDMRLFATFNLYRAGEPVRETEELGPDPFSTSLTAGRLTARLRTLKSPIKTVLLNQHIISGLGNIYACEILHDARIDPGLPAAQITPLQARRLIVGMRRILRLALKYNGTTIRDFNGVDNKAGEFKKMLRVYGRAGQVCLSCSQANVQKITQAQRGTFFCPACQPRQFQNGSK
jgi:formamidopyrimidine-DNA glycosylase